MTKSLRSVSVGAGLPAMTVYQWRTSWLILRYRSVGIYTTSVRH
ncbi:MULTISPECIES: hypothetical protein [Pseudomonas]|nr:MULTISPECIES: hypothetical protein [Pseudomonas]